MLLWRWVARETAAAALVGSLRVRPLREVSSSLSISSSLDLGARLIVSSEEGMAMGVAIAVLLFDSEHVLCTDR